MPNIQKLKEEQMKLAAKILTSNQLEEVKFIGGVDVAYTPSEVIGVVIVMDAKTGKLVDKAFSVKKQDMPYIPGFLFYREAPAIIEAFGKLKQKPDLLFVPANGILHPRRIGLASHLGLVLDTPTIGVAKKLLCGELQDKKVILDKEVRATEISTKSYAKPVYLSPGHRISLKTAQKWFMDLLRGHKLPEPLKLAHRFSTSIKKKEIKNVSQSSFPKP
ncbi:MAG: endonuclease V [Nanoarchaeota archaeon]